MSLFDLGESEGEPSSVRSSRSSSASDGDSPLLPPQLTKQTTATSSAGVGRNTLTEAEVRHAAVLRREQLAQRLTYRGPALRNVTNASLLAAFSPRDASASLSSSTQDVSSGKKLKDGDDKDDSLFGNSIAAALQLRKSEQERLLLKRLQKERERDSTDAALVEKDMEVGVFVTPAYKQLLRRHRGGGQAEDGGAKAEGHADGSSRKHEKHDAVAQDDDDDPLEAYLRQLESKQRAMTEAEDSRRQEQSPASSSASSALEKQGSRTNGHEGDYYDAQMLAGLKGAQDRLHRTPHLPQQGEGPSSSGLPSSVAEAAPPTLEELQHLLQLPPGGTAKDAQRPAEETAAHDQVAPAETPVSQAQKIDAKRKTAVQEAREEHERFLFAARESRKRRRADVQFIEACALRAEERIAKRLGVAA